MPRSLLIFVFVVWAVHDLHLDFVQQDGALCSAALCHGVHVRRVPEALLLKIVYLFIFVKSDNIWPLIDSQTTLSL